ncbi:MAG: matrixin family metalloprotease [Armatimonadetes bacterium]|nr:matrixin family metalloprotease [Armatimonadota bacterium]
MERIHPDSRTIIERLDTKGRVHRSGGGAARAEQKQASRTAARSDTASIRGREMRSRGTTQAATEPTSVPAERRPVTYSLNDRTDTASNITSTTGGPASSSIVGALTEINNGAGQTLVNTTLQQTSATRAANDGTNLISFVQGNYRFNKNTIAVNISFTQGTSTVDSDTLFNPRMAFSTDDSGAVEQKTFDVQGIATHELMHSVGVPHITTNTQATMYPSASRTDDVRLRTLEPEDRAALQTLYPVPPPPPPTI